MFKQPLDQSKELRLVLDKSQEWADKLGRPMDSLILLLATLTFRTHARHFFSIENVPTSALISAAQSFEFDEADEVFDKLMHRAKTVQATYNASRLSSLHVLAAMLSNADGAAYYVLRNTLKDDAARFRSKLMSAISREVKKPWRDLDETVSIEVFPNQRPKPEANSEPSKNKVKRASGGSHPKLAERLVQRLHETGQLPAQKPEAPTELEPTPEPVARAVNLGRERGPSIAQAEPVAKAASADTGAAAQNRSSNIRFKLDPSRFPTLTKFGRNLTLAAAEGTLGVIAGRDHELNSLAISLGRKRKNCAVLVGEPGVGKTAIAHGLACITAGCHETVKSSWAEDKIVVELDYNAMAAGTGVRGSLEERIESLVDEVKIAQRRVIVFIDEIHAWFSSSAAGEIANALKPVLASGDFPCFGASTWPEYDATIKADAALARRFAVIEVEEPDFDTTLTIAQAMVETYEEFHRVKYEHEALVEAIRLSERYLHDEKMPDKAINLLDIAGSHANRDDITQIDAEFVAATLARELNLSVDRVTLKDLEKVDILVDELRQRVVGHEHVINHIRELLQRKLGGFRDERPLGSMLFLGPTGVGKTELAKSLAEVFYDSPKSYLQLNMSEYIEKHSISNLIGSPSGYVGHDTGGLLTNAVRRKPWMVVLLDEIEKAHKSIHNLLLQILDEGQLTDSRGHTVSFKNTIVIMTSNCGADKFFEEDKPTVVGFATAANAGSGGDGDEKKRSLVLRDAQNYFTPEIWGRIESKLVFAPMSRPELLEIARRMYERESRKFLTEQQIQYVVSDEVLELLLDKGGFSRDEGVRALRQTFRQLLETKLSQKIAEVGQAKARRFGLSAIVEDGELRVNCQAS